jgi:hypothetical protein
MILAFIAELNDVTVAGCIHQLHDVSAGLKYSARNFHGSGKGDSGSFVPHAGAHCRR